KHGKKGEQYGGITQQSRAEYAGVTLLNGIFGSKADQAARILHFIHHRVTGVYTQTAIDTLRLQAVTDINIHRAHLHAPVAIDAITQSFCLVVLIRFARAALFAAFVVVKNRERVLVVHHRLKARIGTHVFAHLLAHKAGVGVSGAGKKQYPEHRPKTGLKSRQIIDQLTNGKKVTDKGQRRDERRPNPEALGCAFAQNCFGVPGLGVEFDAFIAVALKKMLRPNNHLGPHSLRAGKATPDTPHQNRYGKEREGGDHQQPGEIKSVVGPEGNPENVEFALAQIEEHGRTPFDTEPGHKRKAGNQRQARVAPQFLIEAGNTAGVNLAFGFVEIDVANSVIRSIPGGLLGILIQGTTSSSKLARERPGKTNRRRYRSAFEGDSNNRRLIPAPARGCTHKRSANGCDLLSASLFVRALRRCDLRAGSGEFRGVRRRRARYCWSSWAHPTVDYPGPLGHGKLRNFAQTAWHPH